MATETRALRTAAFLQGLEMRKFKLRRLFVGRAVRAQALRTYHAGVRQAARTVAASVQGREDAAGVALELGRKSGRYGTVADRLYRHELRRALQSM